MDCITIEKLNWDSGFFGYPVGKIIFNDKSDIEEGSLKHQLQSSNFRLVYLYADPSYEIINKAICQSGAILVDRKIVFTKTTEEHQVYYNHIEEYALSEVTSQLKKLTLASGNFSRFRNDLNFINQEFERLYFEWILKSVRKEIASKIYIATNDSIITGFITLGEENGNARIGLVSVDEQYKGRKIGSELVSKADSEAHAKGYKLLHVATQHNNKAASHLYKSCNFKITKELNVYHYWNSKY